MTHETIRGTVRDIFAHRFTLQTENGIELADLTPRGQETIRLQAGDAVTIEGDRRPSEIKVSRIEHQGVLLTIEPAPKHHAKHDADRDADPELALKAARDAGFTVLAEPRRKPKHFEVLGCGNGETKELHVTLDGAIRKERPGDPADKKWRADPRLSA